MAWSEEILLLRGLVGPGGGENPSDDESNDERNSDVI
jgi:hypothetical protein